MSPRRSPRPAPVRSGVAQDLQVNLVALAARVEQSEVPVEAARIDPPSRGRARAAAARLDLEPLSSPSNGRVDLEHLPVLTVNDVDPARAPFRHGYLSLDRA
jgi:hypothetical protein